MRSAVHQEITRLLDRSTGANLIQTDQARLDTLLFEELRKIAHRRLRGQKDQTLQTTDLVNEAWIRLQVKTQNQPKSREHYLRFAARAMRSVIVDGARRKKSGKRGGGWKRIPLNPEWSPRRALDALELDDALTRLETRDPELVRLVELKFFAGLSHKEIAHTLDKSLSGVERAWRTARAFLMIEFREDSNGPNKMDCNS